jgi:transcriptional regulator with XRE-family HTH domain
MIEEVTMPPPRRALGLLKGGFINEVRTATGLSRNHLGTMMGIGSQTIRKWEEGDFVTISTTTDNKVLALEASYIDASDWLNRFNMTWDDVTTRRNAAMMCGIGTYALDRKIRFTSQGNYIDFGMLGLWVEWDQVRQCQTF